MGIVITSTATSARAVEASAIEGVAGFSRAARFGRTIAVSGTTADGPDGEALFRGDTYAQTTAALQRGIATVVALGGVRESVLRTRVLLAPAADWAQASAAHRDVLGDVAPANSMYYVHSLIGDHHLVEIEIDAVEVATAPKGRQTR